MTHTGVLQKEDIVIQMARCSFDVHILEMLSSIMTGATIVMLRPGGTLDFNYLLSILQRKQITFMASVPSFLFNFFTYLKESGNEKAINCLRSLISGGM